MYKLSWEKLSNETWFTGDSQTDEPEDRNYTNEMTDIKVRRTNPPRFDKRKDWYSGGGEHFEEDNDVSTRYDQTSLASLSWKEASDSDPYPGFIPTNNGMMEPEDIIDDLSYDSYRANRDYDRTTDPDGDIINPDYDFEKSRLKWRNFWTKYAGWPKEKIDRFERKYFNETGGK